MTLLAIQGLRVSFATRHGRVAALDGVDLALGEGETVGLVGESGSGKSVTALAAMRLLDHNARIEAGSIRFGGRDVTRLGPADLRRLRGAAISMIFQNPRAALNPIRTVGQHIADVLRAHRDLDGHAARDRALDLLRAVLIREPERRLAAYPHELSGGMCQRVMIAMAIAGEPDLLIADEPSTGLDVTTQKAVMDLLAGIVAERRMAMILITHDLGLAARYADRIAVMERGRVVEESATSTLFRRPCHPYTRRLVAASPTRRSTLADLTPEGAPGHAPEGPAAPGGTLLEVRDLRKSFGGHQAVGSVSFHLRAGGALGLVGESGSGKSTIVRLVGRLLDADAGDIVFDGEDIARTPASGFHRSPLRRTIQLVFQDPTESLDPRLTAFDSIAHPLRRLLGLRDRRALASRVQDAAARAGLAPDLLFRFPHQLSGGQKARVGIARAIAPEPRLLILDEPTAALDVSVQAVILQLLDRLRREDGIALLFVSHDLNVVRMLCDELVVLQAGEVVEAGPSAEVFAAPRAPYTRALLEAIPHFEPDLAPVPELG